VPAHVCHARNIRAIFLRKISMLNYELRHDEGVLVLHPEGPLEATDFTTLAHQDDTYLAGHGKLRGVLIHGKLFPGWKDFAAMLAHLKFLKDHLKRIEKVAIAADGAIASIMPNIANHFVHARIEHFEFPLERAAWDWLSQSGNAQKNSVA
jgi:hypothetical protein